MRGVPSHSPRPARNPCRRDGYGSYDADMQGCPVFAGLFAVARRLYLLFQQHTTDAFNARAREFLTNDGS